MKTKKKNIIYSKIATKEIALPAAAAITAFVLSMTFNGGVSSASAADQIHASREASASVDQLWDIISNVTKDPQYWSQIHTMRIIKRTDNTIEADTTVGPFNAKGHTITTLNPKQSVITKFTQGPVIGSRTVTLSPLSENKTKIDALWNIDDMPGIPFIGRSFAKDNFRKTTEDALNNIVHNAMQ
jgi:hypothetical protein